MKVKIIEMEKVKKIPVFKTNQNGKINNTTDDILVLNSFWNKFEKAQKKVEETPLRTLRT